MDRWHLRKITTGIRHDLKRGRATIGRVTDNGGVFDWEVFSDGVERPTDRRLVKGRTWTLFDAKRTVDMVVAKQLGKGDAG